MKIDAKVEWLVDEPMYGISVGKAENVAIDMDYVEADEADVLEAIENALRERHEIIVHGSANVYDDSCNANNDFVVTNMPELIEELAYNEFCERVE